jgi:hypothetical protein
VSISGVLARFLLAHLRLHLSFPPPPPDITQTHFKSERLNAVRSCVDLPNNTVLEAMLRARLTRNLFALGDPAIEEVLCYRPSMRHLAAFKFNGAIPDQ